MLMPGRGPRGAAQPTDQLCRLVLARSPRSPELPAANAARPSCASAGRALAFVAAGYP